MRPKFGKLNPNKCCIEIIYEPYGSKDFETVEPKQVLYWNIWRLPPRWYGLLLNPNKCCIEIRHKLQRLRIYAALNPNKCCIEMQRVRQQRWKNCWTQTSVVLKFGRRRTRSKRWIVEPKQVLYWNSWNGWN